MKYHLLAEAKEYTRFGYVVVPTKDKQPIIKWTERRGIRAKHEELELWFNGNNSNIEGLGIILDMSIVVIETDGIGEREFNQKILLKLSEATREAYSKTTHTKSPHGHHRLFRISTEDNPHGIKEITCNLSRNKEGNGHNEIKVLSQNKYINERGPGYQKIIGIDDIVTLSKDQVTELIPIIERFKLELGAIKTVSISLAQYYGQPNRDRLVFTLSGFMHKGGVPKCLIKDTVEWLIDVTGNHDVERQARFKVIEDTCAKDPNSDQVSGYTKLLEAVENNQAVIDELQQVFGQLGYFVNAKRRAKTDGYDIPLDIVQRLGSNVYSVIGENPLTLFIADNSDKKLKKAIIGAPKRGFGKSGSTSTTKNVSDTESVTTSKTTLQYMVKDTVTDTIPINVIINDNPLDEMKTYKITFMHKSSKKPFAIGPGSVSYIISELQNKGRYIKDRETATQALQAILVEYEDMELAEIDHRIPYSGYFYVDNRIVGYDTTQLTYSNDDMLEGISTLEQLYNRSKDEEILITVLKWGLVSPFSFARKQMVSSGDWIPGLHLCGKTQTGKSTKGKFVFALWRLLNTKYERLNIVGFMSTEARFCTTIGRTTYPVLSNEVSGLAVEKNNPMVDLIKHSAEHTYSRSKYNNDRRYIQELALSNIMFTSNGPPPRDAAYRLRYPPISFERNLETTDEAKKEFNLWWNTNHKKLGVFGDFAAQYIMKNPGLLMDLTWHELGQKIIKEFYTQCGKEIPTWIDSLYLSNVVEETNELTYFELRSFFGQAIIDGYRKDPIILRDSDGSPIDNEIGFEQKLDRCLKQRLIQFLHSRDGGTVIITHDIVRELQNKKISNLITMQSIADEIEGFTLKPIRVNGKVMKVVSGKYEDFVEFLRSSFEEEIGG